MPLYLGIDIGTSGCRTAVIDEADTLISSASELMVKPAEWDGRPVQDPLVWWEAVQKCLISQVKSLRSQGRSMGEVEALSVDGTSGTLLLADSELVPVTRGLMYNSANFADEAARIASSAPADSIARGNSSALARLLFLQAHDTFNRARYALHQADWIAGMIRGRGGLSDENNVLKLGYDLTSDAWPDWFLEAGVRMDLLPSVVPVGTTVGTVSAENAHGFGFSKEARVVAGTTDSIAAFLASGASRVGEGVTSLGTTLVLKLLSDRPVNDLARGIYSHRVFGMWLAGGASNSGGGVLEKYFTRERMSELERSIDPGTDTGLDYYPLVRPGERFPVSDPTLAPRLLPKPNDEVTFFQGMLEGIARIENAGYDALAELGAPKVSVVRTTGGGSRNQKWSEIRRRIIGCSVVGASADAAVGSAIVAQSANSMACRTSQ